MKIFGADAEILLEDVTLTVSVEFKADSFTAACSMAEELLRDVINTDYEPVIFCVQERVDVDVEDQE